MTKKKPPAPALGRIPTRLFYGNGATTLISSMIMQAQSNPYGKKALHNRFVLGYPLASWQRPLKWTDEQSERFIQSVYAGIYLGQFIYNDSITSAPHLDGLLIDGQQRLSAIERYLADDLAVTGADGKKYVWSALTSEEQAHFGRVGFGFQIVQIKDEAELKHLYNLLNFAGTPHTEDERA